MKEASTLYSRRFTLIALILAAMFLVPLAPRAAYAGEPVVRSARAELVRVGVDHDVAKAHGYEVRVDNKGVEYAVPLGSPPSVNNEVPGNCGTSWVNWINIDFWGHRATIDTGFWLNPGWPNAWAVPTWDVSVLDAYGSSVKHMAPNTPGGVIKAAPVWNAQNRFTASGPTGAWADVILGWTILTNGTVCWSLNPSDFTEL